MPNSEFFKPAFDALAVDGCIGDPNGKLAYAYIRVSDTTQAEDGRSGLPRQIEHIHDVACKHGHRIPWQLVFADDHSGFVFEDRPSLSQLRDEYKSNNRRAYAVIMEHLDRLSRNADWHQGFLLDEMRKHGIEPIFWKPFNSRIERAVMGAIAQDGMEQAFERMHEGTINKARRGCVTAKVAAFGFKFVDQNGQEGTKDARENTHYALDEDQAFAMRFMYDAIAYKAMSCYELLKEVDERAKSDTRFRPPVGRAWNERTFAKMIRNPVYKGQFIANRHFKERVTEFDEYGMPKTVMKNRQRPEEEWIIVPVPAIVDEATWELANRNLYRNKGFARRNKKHDYLLTDIIRCATCGRRYHGHTDRHKKQRYTCATMHSRPAVREQRPCGQRTIHCEVIDTAVWKTITEALLNPDVLVQAIDARYANKKVDDICEQIAFLKGEIPKKDQEEAKLKQAYLAGAYSAEEFAEERQRLMKERVVLNAEMQRLQAQVMTPEELEERKLAILKQVQQTRDYVNIDNAPFELKRHIVRLLVDEVRINVEEEWFEMKGTIRAGVYQLQDGIGSENSWPLKGALPIPVVCFSIVCHFDSDKNQLTRKEDPDSVTLRLGTT